MSAPGAAALAISKALTLAGWSVIVAACAVATAAALATRGRFPSAVGLTRNAVRSPLVRAIAVTGWLWIGWHFFVRTSR